MPYFVTVVFSGSCMVMSLFKGLGMGTQSPRRVAHSSRENKTKKKQILGMVATINSTQWIGNKVSGLAVSKVMSLIYVGSSNNVSPIRHVFRSKLLLLHIWKDNNESQIINFPWNKNQKISNYSLHQLTKACLLRALLYPFRSENNNSLVWIFSSSLTLPHPTNTTKQTSWPQYFILDWDIQHKKISQKELI
jgi:hypothetical protein